MEQLVYNLSIIARLHGTPIPIGGAKLQRFKAMDSTTRVLADTATALNSAPEQRSGPWFVHRGSYKAVPPKGMAGMVMFVA